MELPSTGQLERKTPSIKREIPNTGQPERKTPSIKMELPSTSQPARNSMISKSTREEKSYLVEKETKKRFGQS